MTAATFRQQARALVTKSALQQRRSVATNLALLFGPVFFCILLFILQNVTNNLLQKTKSLQCGCQCLSCCKDGICQKLEAGYCDEFRGYICQNYNDSACGVRYSSSSQAVWCQVPEPSTWPPVFKLPRPRYFAQPFGPDTTVPVMYTSDASTIDRSSAAAAPFRNQFDDVPATATSGSETDAADSAANQMFLLPTFTPAALPEILDTFQELVNADMTVFNGHLLGRLGLQFANTRRAPWQMYLDSAFVNSGSDLELDTLFVMMPSGTCQQRGLSFRQGRAGNTTTATGFVLPSTRSNTYNMTTFLLKYLSYDYPSLPALLPASGIDMEALARIPLFSSVRVGCIDAEMWRLPNDEAVDLTLYCGWANGYPIPPAQCNKTATSRNVIESYAASYNFMNTTQSSLATQITYNLTLPEFETDMMYRLPSMLNLAVRGWTRTQLPGNLTTGNELLGLMSMPKPADKLRLDFSSLLGPLFYAWVVQLLLPTMLQQLVYEKEKRLRTMMKMHGLGDAAYWAVAYMWWLALYVVYMCVFLIVGSGLGLQYFRRNSLVIQIVFYLLYGQLQLAFTFLLSCLFTSSRTAVVVAYLYVLATGLLGYLLLTDLMDESKPWLWVVEIVPAFSLYRGLYELGAYAFLGVYRNSFGMAWANLHDKDNGMVTAWVIMAVQVPVFLVLAWYLEQVLPTGNGTVRHSLFFLRWMKSKGRQQGVVTQQQKHDVIPAQSSGGNSNSNTSISGVEETDVKAAVIQIEMPDMFGNGSSAHNSQEAAMALDVLAEKKRVEQLEISASHPIVSKGLQKVFPAYAGGQRRRAVQDLTLAVARGECFGLLGPNGAGKTSAINMLTGLLAPTAGTAVVEGFDIRSDMRSIYKLMGVCPQHDLLWEQLTGREHLRFYGRLKGLNGTELEEAINAALKAVNLASGGVGDKPAGKYSGGMKRRLSVAISFMGQPKVVYLDEPSTGLDPASRRNLWDVVKSSKEGRSIILTTHSMEEAEHLCDRLGIFVDGQLVCIGNPKEITSRYAGFFVFTISVPAEQEQAARQFVQQLSPNATLTYALGGTLKYELPTSEVNLSSVFQAVNAAKGQLNIIDWGVANATLEEVFIKLAKNLKMSDRLD